MKKIQLYLIILISIILLTSCELYYGEEEKGKIVLVSIGANYKSDVMPFESSNDLPNNITFKALNGTLNDVKMSAAAIENLATKSKKDFYWIPLIQDGLKNKDELNFATKDNLFNVLNYLLKKENAQTPLIIRDPQNYDLSSSLSDYSTSTTVFNGSLNLNNKDIIIVYYSGHGYGNEDVLDDPRTGDICLLDKDSGNENFVINTVSSTNMIDVVKNSDAKVLFIFDSCFSGNNISPSSSTISKDSLNYSSLTFADKLSFLLNSDTVLFNNIFILTASQENELTYETSDNPKNGGVFTSVLLSAMGWDIDEENQRSIGLYKGSKLTNYNNYFSVDNLYRYAKNIYDISSNKIGSTYLYNPRINGGRQELILFNFNN